MPRRPVLRTPEEEEEYRIRRRKRNTEIQRERRRKMKERSLTCEENQDFEGENLNNVLEYLTKMVTSPTVESSSEISNLEFLKSNNFELLKNMENEELERNEELMKMLRRQKNTEAQRRRRAQLKELKLKSLSPEKTKRTREEEDAYILLRRQKNTESQRRRRQKLREEKLKTKTELESLATQTNISDQNEIFVEILKLCSAAITENNTATEQSTMGKNRKSRQTSDFPKQNRKPGKKLQKTNVTNTTFKAKPLVILNRLSDKNTEDADSGKANLYEILEKLNHLNESTLLHNLERFLKLVVPKPELLHSNLSKIIPVIGRLIHWEGITNDKLKNILAKVLYRICMLPENVMAPHFNHFCTFVTLGLSHCKSSMRILALKCINQLTQSQRASAAKSRELFTAFLRFIACDCVVGKQTAEVLEYACSALCQFVAMYTLKSEKEQDDKFLSIKIHNNFVQIESETPEGIDPFEFKVCGFGSQSDSPVSELEGICTLFDSVFVYFGRIYALDEFKALKTGVVYGVLNNLRIVLQNFIDKNVVKPGVYGDALLKLADKNNFIDAVGQKSDKKALLWFQKLKAM